MERSLISEALVTFLCKVLETRFVRRTVSRQEADNLLSELSDAEGQTLIAAMMADDNYADFLAGTFITRELQARIDAGEAAQLIIDERDRENRARRGEN